MKLASFNVENLFERATAMNLDAVSPLRHHQQRINGVRLIDLIRWLGEGCAWGINRVCPPIDLSVHVMNGDSTLTVNQGQLSIDAAQEITILDQGGGPIQISQGGGVMEVSKGGDLTIKASSVEISGSSVSIGPAGRGRLRVYGV